MADLTSAGKGTSLKGRFNSTEGSAQQVSPAQEYWDLA